MNFGSESIRQSVIESSNRRKWGYNIFYEINGMLINLKYVTVVSKFDSQNIKRPFGLYIWLEDENKIDLGYSYLCFEKEYDREKVTKDIENMLNKI